MNTPPGRVNGGHWDQNDRQLIPITRIVRFAIATAMRQEEICRVTWNDINARTKMLQIRDRKNPRERPISRPSTTSTSPTPTTRSSIEGYTVSPELIERVRRGDWNPRANEADKQHRDAIAARGYWQAFNAVKDSVRRVLAGEAPRRLH